MADQPPDYRPISCDFHDVLESLATSRKQALVRFLDDEGALQHRSAVIQDVYSRDHAEYVSLSSGEVVRLDRLIAVDREKLAKYLPNEGNGGLET
jgi:Rho-binding antiterminator